MGVFAGRVCGRVRIGRSDVAHGSVVIQVIDELLVESEEVNQKRKRVRERQRPEVRRSVIR